MAMSVSSEFITDSILPSLRTHIDIIGKWCFIERKRIEIIKQGKFAIFIGKCLIDTVNVGIITHSDRNGIKTFPIRAGNVRFQACEVIGTDRTIAKVNESSPDNQYTYNKYERGKKPDENQYSSYAVRVP